METAAHERPARRWIAPALAACALLLAACAAKAPGGSTKVALVIGNSAYENASPLVNPGHDAEDMCAALKRLGFRTLCHTNVRDRAEFDARVREYAELLDAGAVGLFYYSGHGVQAGNANFMIPTRAQTRSAAEDPTKVLYAVDELFERIGRRPARFQLVILDACRADLFAPPPRQAARAPGSMLVKSLEAVARAGNGLQPIKDAPASTLVLYATASKDTAFDGEGRNGPLTKHILAHIGSKGIPVEEFIKRVITGVEQETTLAYKRRQTPFIYGSFGGKFCFAGCPGEGDVLLPPSF
jgi:uncharacterized caspase-like protein